MSSDVGAEQIPGGVAPRFLGNTFAFAGLGDESYPSRGVLVDLIASEGGSVIEEVSGKVDYLVVGRTRTGKPAPEQRLAERLTRAGKANITFIRQEEFHNAFPVGDVETATLVGSGEEGVQRWSRLRGDSRTPVDLGGIDLRGADLSGVCFYGVSLDGADLREANLSGAILDQMKRVRLDGARMANFRGTGFTDCSFRNADLSRASLNCPYPIERCDFTGATLRGASPTSATLIDVLFRDADLGQASLTHSKLLRADFTAANLEGAWLCSCELRGANFTGACLRGAELTRADLSGANLTGADLSGAMLHDADLTAANLRGADFTGAYVAGLKFDGADTTGARGLDPTKTQPRGRLGPAVRELWDVARKSRRLETTAFLGHAQGQITLTLKCSSNYVEAMSHGPGSGTAYRSSARALDNAMFDLAGRHSEGALEIDTVTAHGNACPVKGNDLKRLALAAWCEVCGAAVPSEDELRRESKSRAEKQRSLRAEMLADLRGGPDGVERWNQRTAEEAAKAGGFRRAGLKGARLCGVTLRGMDFTGSDFDGADLRRAFCTDTVLRQASFQGADLSGATLSGARLGGANFGGANLFGCGLRNIHSFRGVNFHTANLRKADFGYSDLRGADLSSAELEGAKFERTKHDATTLFPAGFDIQASTTRVRQTTPPPGLEAGTRVRVTFGVFAGLEGEVKEILADAGKTRVELTLFGRAVQVELEYDEVELT